MASSSAGGATHGSGCDLFRPGSHAVIGVLGNSVAWGTGVGPENAWPALLDRSLRAQFGKHIRVVNGAVRASTPDFASLCWDEIWSSQSSQICSPNAPRCGRRQARPPTLDVAVVDYSLSGEPPGLGALLGRIGSLSLPTVGVATCKHPDSLALLGCLSTSNADERCRRWGKMAEAVASEEQRASDSEFWCRAAEGEAGGPAAAAREFARLARWSALRDASEARRSTLHAHARRMYSAAINGTEAEGRAAVQAAWVWAAVAETEPSIHALLARRSASAAARLVRLALLPCSHAGGEWPAAAAAIAEQQCLASAYHAELRRRSVAVAFPSELLTTPRPNRSVHGDDTHPGPAGHQMMADAVEAALLSSCRRLVPRARPAPFPDQTCRFGHRIGEAVSSTSGFAFVDPGEGRTPGYAATEQGSAITLRLRSRESGGFVSVAYECGWRNHAVGRLTCHGMCVCRPALMNTTSHYRTTFSQFSSPVWATLASDGLCTVRVELDEYTSGRLMLTAATFSAPLPGGKNRTIYWKGAGDTLNQNF